MKVKKFKLFTEDLVSKGLIVGDRVKFMPFAHKAISNYEINIGGLTGTVTNSTKDCLSIKLDKHIPDLDYWDNEIIFDEYEMDHIDGIIMDVNDIFGKLNTTSESIKLINQPDGISCGPTCLKMLAELFKINVTIPEIKIVCGTDHKTGTTDVKMIKGLDYLSLDWERFPLVDKQKSFDRLEKALSDGHYVIFRTLIQDIKHWILCDPTKDKFYIFDPWLGEYNLDSDKLDFIWKARDYDGFIIKGIKRVTGVPKIELIKKEEISEVKHMCALVFSNVMSYEENKSYLSDADWSKSVKLTLDDEIVGCYLIKPGDISRKESGGVEGFALAIKPGYRKYGWGELLKNWFEDWAKKSGYKYVWGQHLSGLNNKEFWLKRRELYSDGDELFTTIKRFE